MKYPFTRPYKAINLTSNLNTVKHSNHWAGGNEWGKACEATIRRQLNIDCALLTPSCTAALELSAIIAGLKPSDEVIMPSFTFASTANAVVLRGATPVFVDNELNTLNIDPEEVAKAITDKTRAIIGVHYAGVPCEMHALRYRGITLIEDAAQAYLSTYHGKPAGTLGHMAAFSFHETKHIACGEGGAFVTKHPEFAANAEIIREKGTDRSRFLRGEIDKYTWQDIGSSYVMNEFSAAVLEAQLSQAEHITTGQRGRWQRYYERFKSSGLVENEHIFLPCIPDYCKGNGHIFWLMLATGKRDKLIWRLQAAGIQATSHFQPLHLSPAGQRFGRTASSLQRSIAAANSIVRLPIHAELSNDDIDYIAALAIEMIRLD